MKTLVIIALIVGVVAVVLLLLPSGPRVTTIEHRRDDDADSGNGD